MVMNSTHEDDPHFINRSNWLRAAVLGANDGILSVASLLVGVAAAGQPKTAILIAGAAGLAAGALSMAAGEYVSVSSQSDIERADIKREEKALANNPEGELEELVEIYRRRGVSEETAQAVARELTDHDALGAHIREELGLTDTLAANPLQAGLASAGTFCIGAGAPLLAAFLAPASMVIWAVLAMTILALIILGGLGARAGNAPMGPAILRVLGWGVLAMGVTAAVGWLFGVSV